MHASKGMDCCEIFDGSLGEEAVVLKMMFDIDTGNGPEVPAFGLEGDFQCLDRILKYISSCDSILFFHIGECKSDSWLPVFDANFKVDAEVFLWRCQKLNVELCKY